MKAFEWLHVQRSFHKIACKAWSEKAALYLTGRASAREFIDDVRGRMEEDVWRPNLEPHVLRFFFRAKRNGLPDVYHQVKPQGTFLPSTGGSQAKRTASIHHVIHTPEFSLEYVSASVAILVDCVVVWVYL